MFSIEKVERELAMKRRSLHWLEQSRKRRGVPFSDIPSAIEAQCRREVEMLEDILAKMRAA